MIPGANGGVEDGKTGWGALGKRRAPEFEVVDDGEELIHFRGKEFIAREGDGVFVGWGLGVGRGFLDGESSGGVTRKMLGQDGSNGEVEGVGGDVEMAIGVNDFEDEGGGDELFDGIEGVWAAVVPSEGFILAGEFVEGIRDVGVVVDKGAVVDREDLAGMLKVGLEGGAIDEDIIEVDDDTDFEEVAEDVIHCRLECGGGVRESEGHHKEFVVPESGTEGGLVGILLADADLVEATAEVNIGIGSTESIEKLRDPRQGFGEGVLEVVEDGGEGGVGGGAWSGLSVWEQVFGTLAINDKGIVGGVWVRASHVKELVRGDGAWGGGIGEIGNVDGCVRGVGKAKEVGVENVWHVAVQPRCSQNDIAHQVHDIK
ncbi:hypothetical protein CBR_g40227 [Chara braunii]|uniref:Uncharacterized protein n=1 Tax=Chara braunii TaxID=69332 RepID=A0A388K1Q8_CHABU|nr:hypothetical protein CBR_g40227 [Chara braunii]|eukprot:GBG63984.1 hypothetical protein CBR_g40227 [Chara braunii]